MYKHDIEQSFRKYYGALCYFASQYVAGGDEVVEDLVQDCFVKLLEAKIPFESETHLKNYLYAAVRNNCLNFIGKNRTAERHAGELRNQAAEEPADEVFTAEVVRRLKERIGELPAQCREVMRLSYEDGLDNGSVADLLGVSVNTVRAQKMRGKKLLRLRIGKAFF